MLGYMNTFAWVTAFISLYGTYLVNHKNVHGMYVWMLSNAMWIYYGLYCQVNHPQVFMYGVYTLMNFHGVYEWKKPKIS